MSDTKIYAEYIKANVKVPGMGIGNIPAIIEKLNVRLADPKFADKHKHYKAEKLRLETVLKVENSQ